MSETSRRVLARPALESDHTLIALAREVEALEAKLAKTNEQRLTALGLGDLEREALEVLRPKLAEAEWKCAFKPAHDPVTLRPRRTSDAVPALPTHP